MMHRFLLSAAVCAGFLLTAAAPAFAERGWHGGWHGGGWHGGWHEGWHGGWHPGWGWRGWGPRVVVGGPAYYPYAYPYAYPYPYYPAPGVSVTIPIR